MLFFFLGCTAPIGVEDFAYVLAIGIDYCSNSEIELTLQFATAGSNSSSGSSMQSTNINICSTKCSTIDSGISLLNNHISKKINLSHCQVIIFSEELAKIGLEKYLDTLINNTELTTNSEILISKCTAKNFIEGVDPTFEELLSDYYASSLKSNQYASYFPNMKLATFFCLLKDSYFEPYAPICNLLSEENSTSIEDSLNGNFTAGEYKFSDKTQIQIIGFAAFNKDKFAGEFSGLDAICFSLINNEFKQSVISIPSPFSDGEYLDLSVTSNKKTKCTVALNQNSPTVHINVYLTGFGQSMSPNTSYSSEESINKIQQATEKYMKEKIECFLEKTAKEYNSDICGFGRYVVSHYLTMEEWDNVNWLENYKNCKFDVTISCNIKARERLFSNLRKRI